MAALSEEQQMIKDQASAWVREQAPVSTFRAMRDQGLAQGFFSETWQAMIEMGWTGLVVPEPYGGAGFGYQTLGLVLEQLGKPGSFSFIRLISSRGRGPDALGLRGSKAKFAPENCRW